MILYANKNANRMMIAKMVKFASLMENVIIHANNQVTVKNQKNIAISKVVSQTNTKYFNLVHSRVSKICLIQCQSSKDCLNGELCFAHGQCQTDCFSNEHCQKNSRCFKNKCLDLCDSNGSCKTGSYCRRLDNVGCILQ